LPHLVNSAAMLYMLFAMPSMTTGAGMRAMSTGSHSPALDAAVAALLVGEAVIATGLVLRDVRPAAPLAVTSTGAAVGYPEDLPTDRSPEGSGTLAPWGGPACLLVMSVAMAYM